MLGSGAVGSGGGRAGDATRRPAADRAEKGGSTGAAGGWTPGGAGPSSFRALVNREGTLPQESGVTPTRWGGGQGGGGTLIEIVGLNRGALYFEGVFLNGLCSLRCLGIRNLSAGTVVVRLGSTVGDQLRWQLRNDNLNAMPPELRHVATNTVGAVARLGGFLESNAVFDSIGLISEVTLLPGETKNVVVAFRPEAAHFQPSTVSYDPAGVVPTRVDSYSEHGLSSISIAEESSLSSAGIPDTREHPQQQHNLTSIDGYVNLDATVVAPSDDQDATSTFVAVQQLSIEFHATCCRSAFTVLSKESEGSLDEVFLDFGNQCRIGEVSTRECEILNRSAVELFWRIESLSPPFVVEDVETGQRMASGKLATLAPFTSRRLRFNFRPTDVTEIDTELSFENIADPDNIIQVHLHASVTTAPVDNTLNLVSGTSLDFGEAVAGEWSHQVVAFINISPAPLEVSFSVDKGLEVTFRLETAAIAEVLHDFGTTAIGANSVDLPPSIKETNSLLRDLPPSGSSRTIISELGRGATSSSATPSQQRSIALLGGSPRPPGTPRSPRSIHSDGTFASDVTLDSSQPSSSEASAPALRTYHPPRKHDVPSPLAGGGDSRNPSLASDDPMSITSDSVSAPIVRSSSGILSGARSEAEGGLYRVQDHLKVLEQRQSATIDQIYAKPGVLYRIIVSFRPARASTPDGDGARLLKRTFRINISYRPWGVRSAPGSTAKERKAVVCKARVCTSFISVSPSTIDFGDVEIGTSVKGTISITNLSEIPARVDLRFISKVISAYRNEIEVAVGSTVDVTVDIVPRRTNPSYRKQISVHNLLNPHNSAVCLLKAANVDTRGVAFHSLFYNLLTPTGGNFLEFGSVPLHSTGLRAITIKNTSLAPITLKLSPTHAEDYQLFVRKPESPFPFPFPIPGHSAAYGVSVPSSPKSGAVTPAVRHDAHANGELKERVLDAIFQPPPTRHHADSSVAPSAPSSDASSKSKAACASFTTQLKEGLPGKATLPYGSGVVFKDRGLLNHAEYLDLATGPPVHRMSPRNKRSFFVGEDRTERVAPRQRPPKLLFPPRSILGGPISTNPATGAPMPPRSDTSPPSLKPHGAKSDVSPTTPTKKKAPRKYDTSSTSSASPALTGRRRTRNVFPLPSDPSDLSLDEVLTALEHHSGHPDSSELSSWELEDAYVRKFIALRRRLKNAIASEELLDVSILDVAAQAERTVYIVVHPVGKRTVIQGTSRKQEGKISIQLLSFGDTANPTGVPLPAMPLSQDIPLREVVLRWTTFRSTMSLGQAHINFGQMEQRSSKTKTIVVANGSERPLLYAVRKSGSIASGDLRVADGRHGVIAGYGKHEVSITFEPHFAGTFEETIHVDNIEDPSEGQSVRVKAFILRLPTFSVSTTSLDFGPRALDSTSTPLTVSVANISKSTRTFTMSVDPADFQFSRASLDVLVNPSATLVLPSLTPEEEEEVESTLQKLKISRRKGQPEKAEKYIQRLKALGIAIPDLAASGHPSPVEGPPTDAADAESSMISLPSIAMPEASLAVPEPAKKEPLSTAKRKTSGGPFGTAAEKPSLVFTLEPSSRREFGVVVTPRPLLPSLEDGATYEDISAPIWVTENADSKVSIKVMVKVLLSAPGGVLE